MPPTLPCIEGDPVLARRNQARRAATVGSRVGYLALAIACVAFLVGVLSGLPTWSVTVVLAGMAVATICLIPAIILGYAVKAAEREERQS